MKKRIGIAVGLVLAIIVALGGIKALQFQKLMAAPFVPPPETISSAVVHEEDWQDTLDAIGSITAVQGVEVTTEVAGTVHEIAFESGAVVAAGDLLVRLDTSSEEAQLRSAEAQVEWAKVSAERARKLRADNTVSQSELDSAEASLKQNFANADGIRATIAKKTIRAPFAGRLGIRIVNLGEYLDTGKPIVSLQSLSPVYANFSLPQQYLAVLKTGMKVQVTADTYPGRSFEGTISAMNPNLDSSMRSVSVQATLDNADLALHPGMFTRVQVQLPSVEKVLVIPATSVLSAPYGDSVFVIESQTNSGGGLVVRQQFIRTGHARGDFVSVETGVKPGERVVSSGVFKLRNGMPVTENNETTPKPSEKPKPADS